LRASLRKRLEKTRLSAVGLDLDDSNPDAHFKNVLKRIFEKHKSENPFGVNKEGYFTDASGENLAIVIRPTGDAADQKFSRAIIDRLHADIKALNPQNFHPKNGSGARWHLCFGAAEFCECAARYR
jgi:hypothetical protein